MLFFACKVVSQRFVQGVSLLVHFYKNGDHIFHRISKIVDHHVHNVKIKLLIKINRSCSLYYTNRSFPLFEMFLLYKSLYLDATLIRQS
jgi:hypothetical protein